MNAKNLVALILAITVCVVILSTAIGAIFVASAGGAVTETLRVKTFELLTFILGVVSGWLLGRGEPIAPPPAPPPESEPKPNSVTEPKKP